MKKKVVFMLAVSIALLMCVSAMSLALNAGTYEGVAKGYGGDITVSVTVDAEKILEVEVLKHEESAGVSDAAFEKLPEMIIQHQTVALDAVAGCTSTSKAILEATRSALLAAGAKEEEITRPLSQTNEETRFEEKSADVVVIGAGGAGLSAAIEAMDKGAGSVILLEKLSAIGGTTFISQGVIGGYNTQIAKKANVELTYEAMYDNLMSNAVYRLDPELTAITVKESGATIDWLQTRVEIPFTDEIKVGYGPLQMMHVMDGGGMAMKLPFENALSKAGVEVLLETKAVALLMDAEGGVKGVRAQKGNTTIEISAKAVVVATGGYANNPELTALLDPEKAGTFGIGFSGSTGDGIIMACNIGAALTHTNHMMCVLKDYEIMSEHNGNSATANVSRFIAAPNLVLVGQDAKRFVDEKSGGYMTQELNAPVFEQMHKDKVGYVWAITDTASQEELKFARGLEMNFIQADSAEALAEKMELNGEVLAETINRYNEAVANQHDPEFGRLKMTELKAPYIAVKVVPCEIITYGGIARNEKAQVIRADATVIPGLYVAGEAAANSAYMGFTLSNCFTWGRIAGANAAAYAAEK